MGCVVMVRRGGTRSPFRERALRTPLVREARAMKQLWDLGDFIRGVGARLRFGELSRAPLRLVRIDVRAAAARCDWIARDADRWDSDLPPAARAARASLQALADAIALRHLLFATLPSVRTAELRSFRETGTEPPGLIIRGAVSKETPPPERASSIVMRALLGGFQFCLSDGILRTLDGAEPEVGAP
jgi:hypothetical protein